MSTIIDNNRIITQTWSDYNDISEGIMSMIDYKLVHTKVSHIISAMKLVDAKEYSIEVDIANIELEQYEDNIDVGLYAIIEKDYMYLYLYSSTLDVQHKCTSSVNTLYEDIRELVVNILQDPIDSTY